MVKPPRPGLIRAYLDDLAGVIFLASIVIVPALFGV